ncbi:hypothetical protein OCF84_21210 (plasmid) [Shewanella xiamenensis]|uniref:Uncharacterized protein n=1 Tax=Shewanella xiamenensis TaxID=332186 RepID=A0ABT6UH51_9GAMM|nr:hypothetical protein [Shewanella xiamenensis]MDI5832604.1 hypothetical protein [Shewanella xiamenensis]WHF57778.1 hypothetical protein OCF84_21210 [Shewanella xiamenensis]
MKARIRADRLLELDDVVAEATNLFNSTTIRMSQGKYKVGAVTTAVFGLLAIQAGLGTTLFELSKDGSLAAPFSDMLKPEYLGQLLDGSRQFAGEYITAAGMAITAASSPIAKLATAISTKLHSLNYDPLTRVINLVGNEISDEFRQKNINQIVNAVAYYYEEISKSSPHDVALKNAWHRVENSLAPAKAFDMEVIAGDVVSALSQRVESHSKFNVHEMSKQMDADGRLYDLDFDDEQVATLKL